jgi:signal transduction histidine kinase
VLPFRNLNYRSRGAGLVLLGCLLVILAGLQYHWLNEISQAEIQQTRRQLEAATNHLACEFDLEIARATMAFQPGPGRSAGAPRQAMAEAWRDWRRGTAHPELVLSVLLLDWSGGRWVAVSVGEAREVRMEDVPFQPPAPDRFGPGQVTMAAPSVLTVHGNPVAVQPVMTIPNPFEPGSRLTDPQISWIVLTFNGDYLLHKVLPGLAQRNLASVAQTEYALRVRADGRDQTISASGAAIPSTEWRTADVTVPLFRDRLDCSAEGPFRGGVSVSAGVGMAQVVRVSPSRQVQAQDGYVVSSSGPVLLPVTGATVAAAPDAAWRLLVRHGSGSLDQAFADFRRRNLLASLGVLLVLGASIASLTLSAERARFLAKAQTEMAIGLSHELKTPLTALRIAAANLQSGAVANREQANRYGCIIDEQSRRLLALVENTLQYARAQPSVSTAVRTVVAPEKIVRAALANRAEEIERAGMRVEVTAEGLPMICGDAALLTHCIENLIDNAVKYAAGGEYLGVRAELLERGRRRALRFTVEDHGGGIARQDLPHVFEPFYRGVATRNSRSEGIGVGLAFVKRVIEAHGGRVEARSAAGGAAFALEVPA